MDKALKKKLIKWMAILTGAGALAGALGVFGLYLYIWPNLPEIDDLKDVQFQVPLRVYTSDDELIAEFGEKRRSPVAMEDVPERMVQAFLAAEDDRFYEHPGVDYQGILRAVFQLIVTGERAQGGSTITMQVARNFYLSREKTYFRKLTEIFLSFKIEQELSKNEILSLYLNKIYLGQRSYGVQAAAQSYYGVTLDQLTLPQIAMIAGLPKAPSTYNPIVNPARATLRRNYVLRRMNDLEYIDEDTYREAMAAPVTADRFGFLIETEAPYVAEMVRKHMTDTYGDAAYTAGFKVYTTIKSDYQKAANKALYNALTGYTERHGYKGPEGSNEISGAINVTAWDETLAAVERPDISGIRIALVTSVEDKQVAAYLKDGRIIPINWEQMQWARVYIDNNTIGPELDSARDILKPGDLIRVQMDDEGLWHLAQIPDVQGGLVSLRAHDGAIMALAGGFDFEASKFNRITQAERQPGSNFKPFVYSAALEHGFTPATLVNDAPVVFEDPGLEKEWRPENYSGKFYGPTRLRVGLYNSRNLISIRLLREVGIRETLEHVKKFGFNINKLPKDLSLALGSGAVRPMDIARGYAVFANGGYLVEPWIIERIIDQNGDVLEHAQPVAVCDSCEDYVEYTQSVHPGTNVDAELNGEYGPPPIAVPDKIAPRAIPRQNVYLMTSMMQDVVRLGTARRALSLGRPDIGGKTGTTNDQQDAWFSGFNPDLVATAWVGFDEPQPMGSREAGGYAALPMWIDFMRVALRDYRVKELTQPPGLVTVRINPETGELAEVGEPDAIFETFRADNVPGSGGERMISSDGDVELPPTVTDTRSNELMQQLF